jgi:hypothetical protein
MYFYEIIEKNTNLELKKSLQTVSEIIALENFQVFVYFSSGNYQVWRLLDKTLESEGYIGLEIKKFALLSNLKMAYIDKTNYCLRVLDLKLNKQIESKRVEQVPTLAMLSNQERNEDSKLMEALNYNTKLKSLPESDTILLLENKAVQSTSFENIINVYKVTNIIEHIDDYNYVQPGSVQPMCDIKALNRRNLFAVFNESFYDQPLTFLLWDVNFPKGHRLISVAETVNFTIIHSAEWSPTEIAFWVNPEAGGPEVKVIQIENLKEAKAEVNFKNIIYLFIFSLGSLRKVEKE